MKGKEFFKRAMIVLSVLLLAGLVAIGLIVTLGGYAEEVVMGERLLLGDVAVQRDLNVYGDGAFGDDLTVTDDVSMDALTASGAASFASTLGVTGVASFADDVTVDDTFNIDDTDLAQAATYELVPTASYYQLAPLAASTLTISTTGALDGDILILHSVVATATTIADTTCTVGGTTVGLTGTGDMAIFIFGNGVWCEIVSPDNS